MFVYSFSIRSSDGRSREETGWMSLPNDYVALAFGNDVIRDLLHDNTNQYPGWTMDVVCLPPPGKGGRVDPKRLRHVASIAFPFSPQDRLMRA